MTAPGAPRWRRRLVAAYSSLLLAFSGYMIADTFWIERVYSVVETPTGGVDADAEDATSEEGDGDAADDSGVTSTGSSAQAVITDTSYVAEGVAITLTEYREFDTTIHVADIQVDSAQGLRTAFAQSAYGRNITETTSSIAAAKDAILAINGDFYGAQNTGYVLRDGIIYRDTGTSGQEALVVDAAGDLSIIDEGEVALAELEAEGVQQVLSFGPGLIVEGQIAVTDADEVDRAMSSNPRTAIGQVGEGHYVFVVSDGRTSESEGLTLVQLAEFMESLGAVTAYNLDGGGSSTMYFNGQVINKPTTNGRDVEERSVSDIVYIGS